MKKDTSIASAAEDLAAGVFGIGLCRAVLCFRRIDSEVCGDRGDVGGGHIYDRLAAAVGAHGAVDFVRDLTGHRLKLFDAVVVRRKVTAEVYILRLLDDTQPGYLHQIGGKHD